MAAASSISRAPFLLPLARQLLPLRVVVAPSARLPPPAPARRLCLSLQLLRHCASSSSPRCERVERLKAPSTAAGASCDSSEGETAERGGDDKAAGAQDKGPVCPAAPAPLRAAAAPARGGGRRRPASRPKGRPGEPRPGGGGKINAADTAQAKRKGKGRGQRGRPGPPREGSGGGGGVIHSVPSSSTTPSSSSSSSSASSSS